MAKFDINKECLLTMVKRITLENASLPKKFLIESIHNNQQILSSNFFKKKINYSHKITRNNSTDNTIKKTKYSKIKFLEKNNIQINEQNVLYLKSKEEKKLRNPNQKYIKIIIKMIRRIIQITKIK